VRVQILDLDGCISDDRWRRMFIPNPPSTADCFRSYHAGCWLDEFVNRQEVDRKARHVIFTGRPLLFRQMTLDWLLESARIVPFILIMRNNDDTTPSVLLKQRMLQGLLDPNNMYDVGIEHISAIDDRTAIVDMYKAAGIRNARVVRIGTEEHLNG
jgi:hypothetical protein